MTRAPNNLLAVRRLLLNHLDVDPDTVRTADLEPGEVGVVADSAHRGGYHCGSDRLDASRDYSVVESARDHIGLTGYASALDVGMFTVVSAGRTHTLRTFSAWCMAQCAAGTSDTRDIREIIYSPDGRTVKRWDRLGKRSSGDSSHLTHTHFSFFRDSTRAGRDLTPLFRRYLTTIGILENDMITDDDAQRIARAVVNQRLGRSSVTVGMVLQGLPAQVAGLDVVDEADRQAIIAGILAGLTPEAIAAAIPPELAAQVADELARRIVE